MPDVTAEVTPEVTHGVTSEVTHDVIAIVTPDVTRGAPQKIKIKIIQIKNTARGLRTR